MTDARQPRPIGAQYDPRGDHPLKAPLRSATGGGLAAFHPYSRAGERGRPGDIIKAR